MGVVELGLLKYCLLIYNLLPLYFSSEGVSQTGQLVLN